MYAPVNCYKDVFIEIYQTPPYSFVKYGKLKGRLVISEQNFTHNGSFEENGDTYYSYSYSYHYPHTSTRERDFHVFLLKSLSS